MKKSLLFVFLHMFSAFCLAGWEQINVPTTKNLNSIQFFGDRGFIGADSGVLLISPDKGETWNKVNVGGSIEISSVAMPSENVIYAAGSKSLQKNGWLFSSHDGGQTWDEQMVNEAGLYFVIFKDSLKGYIGGHGLFLQETSDGGISWTDVNIPGKDSLIQSIGFYSMQFPTPAIGYVSAYNYLYKTVDGGASWNEKINRFDKSKYYGDVNSALSLFKINFVSPKIGFFTEPLNYYDTYTGATWSGADSIRAYSTTELNSIAAFFFFDSIRGHAVSGKSVASENKVFSTSNGGVTWSLDTVLTSPPLKDAAVVNERTAMAVGDSGIVLKYTRPTSSIQRLGSPSLKLKVKKKIDNTIYYDWDSKPRDTKGRSADF